MSHILSVARETFLRLRRDRIFLPAAIVGIGLLLLSGTASFWGVEEFYKILYDLSTTIYHFVGVTVAVFWGIKIIGDSASEGSLEVQLASPVARGYWLIGKYLGLLLGLCFLAILLLVGLQFVYLGYGMGALTVDLIGIFFCLSLSWFVMAAVAVLTSVISSGSVALFVSFWVFIAGLLTAPLMQSLAPDTPENIRYFMEFLAGVWNLHYFNLYEMGAKSESITWTILNARLLYGFCLVALLLSISVLCFQNKDLSS